MKWYGYVIIALVLLLAGLGWMYSGAVKDREAVEADFDSLETVRIVHVNFLKALVVEHNEELAKLDKKLIDTTAYFQSRIAQIATRDAGTRDRINPVNVVMASDTAEHRRQLLLRDTAIANCDSTKATLYAQIKAVELIQTRKDSVHAKKENTAEKSVGELAQAAYINSQRADRAEKKLDNPWSFGLHAGYGATLAGGQLYAGPQVGAGVSYKIRLRKRK